MKCSSDIQISAGIGIQKLPAAGGTAACRRLSCDLKQGVGAALAVMSIWQKRDGVDPVGNGQSMYTPLFIIWAMRNWILW